MQSDAENSNKNHQESGFKRLLKTIFMTPLVLLYQFTAWTLGMVFFTIPKVIVIDTPSFIFRHTLGRLFSDDEQQQPAPVHPHYDVFLDDASKHLARVDHELEQKPRFTTQEPSPISPAVDNADEKQPVLTPNDHPASRPGMA